MFVIVAGLLLCIFEGAHRSGAATMPITMETSWSGVWSNVTERTEWVIMDAATWEQVWKQIHPEVPPPPVPLVDFSRSMVIGVAMGERPSGGFAVRITEIGSTGNELVVHVEETTPPEDAMTIAALTYPYHFVAVVQSSYPVRFEWGAAVAAPASFQ